MAKSKLAQIYDVIRGSHYMGQDELRDYRAARTARNSLRCVYKLQRVKKALKNNNVLVSMGDDGNIIIHNWETNQTWREDM